MTSGILVGNARLGYEYPAGESRGGGILCHDGTTCSIGVGLSTQARRANVRIDVGGTENSVSHNDVPAGAEPSLCQRVRPAVRPSLPDLRDPRRLAKAEGGIVRDSSQGSPRRLPRLLQAQSLRQESSAREDRLQTRTGLSCDPEVDTRLRLFRCLRDPRRTASGGRAVPAARSPDRPLLARTSRSVRLAVCVPSRCEGTRRPPHERTTLEPI